MTPLRLASPATSPPPRVERFAITAAGRDALEIAVLAEHRAGEARLADEHHVPAPGRLCAHEHGQCLDCRAWIARTSWLGGDGGVEDVLLTERQIDALQAQEDRYRREEAS